MYLYCCCCVNVFAELKVIWAELSPSQNQLLHKFSTRLLEDASAGVLSYTDFLCNIHNKIQMKL